MQDRASTREKFSSYLEKEFLQRKESNPSYSLRAFARFLCIDQSALSKYLRGERNLSWVTINQCLEKLSPPKEVLKDLEEEKTDDYVKIEDALFVAMSEWKYWAILEYFKINPEANKEEIAKRFHLDVNETEEIISKLILLGFVKKEDSEYKILKANNRWVVYNKTSEAKKELQRKLTKLSNTAIDKFPIDQRYHGSLTVAIDKKKLPSVKKRLIAFQEELGKSLQSKSKLDEVYQLTVSFFPLTILEKE